MNQDAAEGESTATMGSLDQDGPGVKPCRFCQAPVQQPTRKGQVKDFCTDRHRAAFRDSQAQAAVQNARNAIQETLDELARLSARLKGSDQLLARFQRHGRRPRSVRKPAATYAADLAKALDIKGFTADEKK